MEKLNKYTNMAHIAKTNEIVEEVNKLQKDGGKINTVKVNNSPLPIAPEDKSVNIDLSEYSPLYHSHRADQVVGLEEKFAPKTHSHAMSQITGLDTALAGKSPTEHKHSAQDIIGLDSNLANHSHTMTQITGLTGTLADKAPAVHSHKIADVTELNNELNKKSPLYHSHRADEVVGLEEKFASISHNHSVSQITGLANVAKTGNYSDLKNAPTSLSAFINDTKFITKDSDITGNAVSAFKATQDSVGNVIKDTYAKKENIYLYVGKNPIVSELNENTIVIDPDEVNNGTAQPVIDAYTKAKSDQKYIEKTFANTTYATKTEVNSKASKSTSLSGYGIKDAYTKDQVDMCLEDKATLAMSNVFSAPNTFTQKIEQGIRGFSTSNITNIRDNQTDFILLNAENNTAITINAPIFFGQTNNAARVCCVLIYGAGAPIITWAGCSLFCEAPRKTANKKTLITFLINGQDYNLVSASYEE